MLPYRVPLVLFRIWGSPPPDDCQPHTGGQGVNALPTNGGLVHGKAEVERELDVLAGGVTSSREKRCGRGALIWRSNLHAHS